MELRNTWVKRRRRARIHRGIRKKIRGTASMPRLSVFRSNRDIYAQIIDDVSAHTLVSCSSREKEFGGKGKKVDQAKQVGKALGERAKAAGIGAVVFDRSGYLYHGRVQALAEGAREGGLKF